ncbi:MAG: CRTAC1 family protein [Acidobacteriia bacterium]|nr:CRTAC1 family protein [Terriglobia bacterium]
MLSCAGLGAVLPAAGGAGSTGQRRARGPGFTLIDVAAQAGLSHAINICGGIDTKRYLLEEFGCGAAFFDYDNDGWQDIFLVNATRLEGDPNGPEPSNFLFHNNRDGTFTDVTRKAGLVRSGWGQGVCIGDYDNDGFDDLFVTYWGQNVLYHNNGDGTFTDVTAKAGLLQTGARPRWNIGCCFVDYDRDGNLDLFISDYVNFDFQVSPLPGANRLCTFYGVPVGCGPQGWAGGTNILYHNRGDGTFEDVSERSGVTTPRGPDDPVTVSDNWIPVGSYGMGTVAADFDNDGWPDIYVSNDEAPSLLYHNNHDGTFTEMGVAAGCAVSENGSTQGGMGVAVGDYDCDGWLDILKPNFSDETVNLYHNNGNGTFYDAVFRAGLAASTRSIGWGPGLVDFDNDGWKDIFISTGHVYPEIAARRLHITYAEPKILYRNLGNGRFEDVSAQAGPGVTQPKVSRGCAFGDFDNDGDVDVVVNNMNEAPSLLRNDCETKNNWLKVKCIGTKSNRSAIGARVRVVTGQHAQIEEVMSGSSYVSQNDFRLHFGLGQAARVDRLEVRWPLGLVERYSNLEVNQLVVVEEGSGIERRRLRNS